jgi:hypothetical protein
LDPWLIALTWLTSYRYHGKALLVSFDSDNEAQQRTDAVTREAHAMFKKLDKEIRSMDQRDSSDDDQQV